MSSIDDELSSFFNDSSDFGFSVSDASIAPVKPPEEPLDVMTMDRSEENTTLSIDDMLTYMLDQGGSDLFLTANSEPMVSVHDRLEPVVGFSKLSEANLQRAVYSILSEEKRKIFEETKELDIAYAIPGVSRFRVNVFRSKGNVAAVMRAIPFEIKPLAKLGMPPQLNKYADFARGLVLITGPTGSGKSTTLAAIIDLINRTKSGHILTIEDPIEFVHSHKNCIVNQREVGTDTASFSAALRAALREAPKYVLVGEMRDLETISLAVSIAETGHLVFGTLHTQSAPETISRIVDVFPAEQQDQIRTQLAATLQAVVCQNLIRTADGKGRVAALEIMNITPAIKTKIIKNQLGNIVSDLQTGSQFGMQTMDDHLVRLVREGKINVDEALDKAHRRADMEMEFGGPNGVERMRTEASRANGFNF